MAQIKYNYESFIATLEPGISVLVMESFKEKLQEKMENAVSEVWKELEKELPNEIKTRIDKSLGMEGESLDVRVNVAMEKKP